MEVVGGSIPLATTIFFSELRHIAENHLSSNLHSSRAIGAEARSVCGRLAISKYHSRSRAAVSRRQERQHRRQGIQNVRAAAVLEKRPLGKLHVRKEVGEVVPNFALRQIVRVLRQVLMAPPANG